MKVVAISQRIEVLKKRGELRDTLDQNIIRFLLECGFLAVPLPNIFSKISQSNKSTEYFCSFMNKFKPNACLLSGGNNIGDNPTRDETELAIICYAEQQKLPLLGICRGMQIMAHKAGVRSVPVAGHAGTTHKIKGEIFGEANSYHDFCISECPEEYTVISKSDDNKIEAIKHQRLPWEGWMWHPERELSFKKRDVDRVKALFNG